MILKEWQKFKGWAVLEYFLSQQKRIHLKGLAKELKISPRTAQIYLQLYEKDGLLDMESIGNLKLYSLADSPLTRELRRAYLLLKITAPINGFVKENRSVTGVILYGSAAKGEYDSSSDIDLLVISDKKELNLKMIKGLETDIGKEVRIDVLGLGELRRLADKQDSFYKSVIKNNIQLYGATL